MAIGETTFGGVARLRGTGNLTYADIMELSLQRSRTAREMIASMDELVRTYGYGGTAGITGVGGASGAT